MTQKHLCRGILIIVLSVGLVIPARAGDYNGVTVLIAVTATTLVAAVVVVALVATTHHRHKKIVITGCVTSGEKGMMITDEKDGRGYSLLGNVTDIKPGDRMRLHGRRFNGPDKTLVWKTQAVIEDFGACQP